MCRLSKPYERGTQRLSSTDTECRQNAYPFFFCFHALGRCFFIFLRAWKKCSGFTAVHPSFVKEPFSRLKKFADVYTTVLSL